MKLLDLRLFAVFAALFFISFSATAQTGFDDDVNDEVEPVAPISVSVYTAFAIAAVSGAYLLTRKNTTQKA